MVLRSKEGTWLSFYQSSYLCNCFGARYFYRRYALYFTLPVDRYPKITPPQVSVRATYPGADSEVVAQTVAEVIEKNVVGIEDLDNISSTSNSNGTYSLNVQFESGTDSDMATIRVQNGVSASEAALPDTVRSIGVTTHKSSGDMALVISLLSPNGTYDDTF